MLDVPFVYGDSVFNRLIYSPAAGKVHFKICWGLEQVLKIGQTSETFRVVLDAKQQSYLDCVRLFDELGQHRQERRHTCALSDH